MNWTDQVDIYCERTDLTFWSEPLNAVTNAAFVIAALICLRAARRAGRAEALTLVLTLILIGIGVGSFLFHTFATRWAGMADTLPIVVYILVYLYAATRRYLGANQLFSIAAPFLFLSFAVAFGALWSRALPSINGSEGYFPVLIVLIGFSVALGLRRHGAAAGLLAAAALFSLSLTFRSVDAALCGAVPIGTHFMWHVLNGTLLGVTLITFIRHGARAETKPG